MNFKINGINNKTNKPIEIIEFPVLKVNARTFEIEAVFHQYVEPSVHNINPICTDITGITQQMVDGQLRLRETLERFDQWMNENGLLDEGATSAFVTCGHWDLKTQLPRETARHGIHLPKYFNSWINIKRPFLEVTKLKGTGLMGMLKILNIAHTGSPSGRHHSGINDIKNLAKIVKELAARGHVYKNTKTKRVKL